MYPVCGLSWNVSCFPFLFSIGGIPPCFLEKKRTGKSKRASLFLKLSSPEDKTTFSKKKQDGRIQLFIMHQSKNNIVIVHEGHEASPKWSRKRNRSHYVSWEVGELAWLPRWLRAQMVGWSRLVCDGWHWLRARL